MLDFSVLFGELTKRFSCEKVKIIIKQNANHTGQVAEQGNHTELLARNGIYARLVRRQLEKQNNQISEQGPAPGPADLIDSLI